MISNFNYCYTRCPNGGFYLQITNSTTFYIYFTMSYRLNGRIVSKQTPVFAPGKREQLLFPSDIPNITFVVFNAAKVPPTDIVHLTVLANEPICYDVRGNAILTQCIRVPC